MKNLSTNVLFVLIVGFYVTNCGPKDGSAASASPQSSSLSSDSGSSTFSPAASSGSKSNPISLYDIPAGVAIDCAYLNPVAIKELSQDTILWLASIQASGVTLHENYLAARQAGYTGAFGRGQHLAWLAQDPLRQIEFNQRVAAIAYYPMPNYGGTFASHHVLRRAAGYAGLFMCGGDVCFQEGRCDKLGRAL